MNSSYICPIVEGHGEEEAVPHLIRRIYSEYGEGVLPEINKPIRVKPSSFIQDAEYFQKYVALASMKAASKNGKVLILLDCDDECPASIGPKLLADAMRVRTDVPIVVVLATREYESWFLAAADSLRGYKGLSETMVAPENFEQIRGAKEWLSQRMSVKYSPINHQAAFTIKFDLEMARKSLSFDRLIRKLLTVSN
jgi:hypothetical protein